MREYGWEMHEFNRICIQVQTTPVARMQRSSFLDFGARICDFLVTSLSFEFRRVRASTPQRSELGFAYALESTFGNVDGDPTTGQILLRHAERPTPPKLDSIPSLPSINRLSRLCQTRSPYSPACKLRCSILSDTVQLAHMFSKHFTGDDLEYPYNPDASLRHCFVRLIHGPDERSIGDEVTFRDLLGRSANGENAHSIFFFITTHTKEVFAICTTPLHSGSTNSLNDAITICQDFIESSSARSTCVAFSKNQVFHGRQLGADQIASLIILLRYDGGTASTLGLSQKIRDDIAHQVQLHRVAECANTFSSSTISFRSLRHWTHSSGTLLHAFFIGSVCLFVSTILIFSARVRYLHSHKHAPNKYHIWRAYDVSGSTGPQYQLALDTSNATGFKEMYIHNSSEWFLRIDDQALVPAHLISAEEREYQTWLVNQYPILGAISRNESYLDPEWLGSPAVNQVQVDDMFHFSHCVLALRRYIEAKQRGKHVCARDIDEEHMRHCLDALDWWAFPKEGRNGTVANPERPFWWRTKVCFY